MGWARFDDAYSDHPKILEAGPWAELLDMRAIIYCARYETDGFVSKNGAKKVGHGIRKLAQVVEQLVAVGRWREDPEGGWWVVDFLDYNPSKASKDKERAAARSRMARNRQLEVEGSDGAANGVHVRPNNERSSRAPSRPRVVTKHHLTGTTGDDDPPVDDGDNSSQAVDRPTTTAAQVLDLMAASRVNATPNVRNPEGYKRAVLRSLEAEHGARLALLLDEYPTAPPACVAGALLGEPNRLGDYRRPRP